MKKKKTREIPGEEENKKQSEKKHAGKPYIDTDAKQFCRCIWRSKFLFKKP